MVSALATRPWVRGVVGARQVLEIQAGIKLRGRDVGVPEHFLDSPQILRGL